MIRLESSLLPSLKEALQTLVLETLDHMKNVTRNVTLRKVLSAHNDHVQLYLTAMYFCGCKIAAQSNIGWNALLDALLFATFNIRKSDTHNV